jgi:hypothetical protein
MIPGTDMLSRGAHSIRKSPLTTRLWVLFLTDNLPKRAILEPIVFPTRK